MIDIKSFNKALKSTWIKKYLDKDNHGKWKLFSDLHLTDYGGTDLFKGNLNKNDLHKYYKILFFPKSCKYGRKLASMVTSPRINNFGQ